MRNMVFMLLAIAPALVVYLLVSVQQHDRGGDLRISGRATEARDSLARARTERLTARLAAAEQTIEEMQRRHASLRAALTEAMTREGGNGGPDALDQYVLSFADGTSGSEYYRLAVEAHALGLAERIAALVDKRETTAALRTALARILGTDRFRGDRLAIRTLLGLLRAKEPTGLMLIALGGLHRIGGTKELGSLERALWDIRDPRVRAAGIKLIARLAGPEANRRLESLLRGARNDGERGTILEAIDRSEPGTAIAVLRATDTLAASIRLRSANIAGRMRGPLVREYLDDRIAAEQDPKVLVALKKSRAAQDQVPRWHALQATGEPDAIPPNQDNPKAWATSIGAMGRQWIELTYKVPQRADRVRIFEVNSPGAVVEVIAIDTNGRRHEVWRGTDPTQQVGVFEVRFALTANRIRRVRIVLNTSVTPAWNEIDAVELVGPGRRAWASDAVASSNYGQ